MELNFVPSAMAAALGSRAVPKIAANFQIVRLAAGDAQGESDHLTNFKTLVLSNEEMYPAIDQWYRKKVVPGIRAGERAAFVGYLHERPVVSAVVKKGVDAKFCHLRIDDELQNSQLGELFFSVMALEIRDLAKTIHFTLPQRLWHTKSEFFSSFGFQTAEVADKQYRLFDRELQCFAPFANVWRHALEKLPKISHLYDCDGFSGSNKLLFSMHPCHAASVMRGTKTVELRRKFSTRWIGHKINVYASAPTMSLVGEACIDRIVSEAPEQIWRRYKEKLGCTRTQFDVYARGAETLYAIELNNVRPYRSELPLRQMSHLINEDLHPPQSYCTLERNRPWAKAVSIAAYLHAAVQSKFKPAPRVQAPARRVFERHAQSELKLPEHKSERTRPECGPTARPSLTRD
jgi:predicted transcriptional regulator/N-acetylglutamate synthase-like GNAT family acetyltransferase